RGPERAIRITIPAHPRLRGQRPIRGERVVVPWPPRMPAGLQRRRLEPGELTEEDTMIQHPTIATALAEQRRAAFMAEAETARRAHAARARPARRARRTPPPPPRRQGSPPRARGLVALAPPPPPRGRPRGPGPPASRPRPLRRPAVSRMRLLTLNTS